MSKKLIPWIVGVISAAIVIPFVTFAFSAPQRVESVENAIVLLTNDSTEAEDINAEQEKQLAIHQQKFQHMDEIQQLQRDFFTGLVEEMKK